MVKKKFSVKSVRTIKSPSGQDITTYVILINFSEIPDDISMDVNPRKPRMTTSVAKELVHAVKSADEVFDINNRGIVITAKNFVFNPKRSEVEIDLGDNTGLYGILDGGHTYTAIINHRSEITNKKLLASKFVKVEIIVGADVDIPKLADARNTSIQVSDIALYELDNKFEIIKKYLKNEIYANDVAYKDNDNKSIPVVELLKLMFMFNIDRFPNDSSAPVSAYSAKAAVFRDYKKELLKESNIYVKLSPLLPDLVNLYETIEDELPSKYREYKNVEGTKAKFGLLRGVTRNEELTTTFNKKMINYDIANGFLLPIFGAFRALIKHNNNTIEWQFDPILIWEKIGSSLAQNTFDSGTNPNTVGKSRTLWQANYRIVDSAKKDLMLAQLTSKLNQID